MAGKMTKAHGSIINVQAKYVNKSRVIDVKMRLDYSDKTFGELGSLVQQESAVVFEADQEELPV